MKKILLILLILNILIIDISAEDINEKTYIKWVDFKPDRQSLSDAAKLDIDTVDTPNHISWIDTLSYMAVGNGNDFSDYSKTAIDNIRKMTSDGSTVESHIKNKKLFNYYKEAYGAVLDGLLGYYTEVRKSPDGSEITTQKYGIRCFSPIAKGFYYNDYNDFGASRSYGYKRKHLGHDMLGNVGTPIIAVESGYVEAVGWNNYGGWRIGIRSFDGNRYYYYAHLRKGHPYNDMYEGKIVNAGEVIGYLGMTGYSSKENTNNIDTPHLHFGLELIFDPSQKDGYNQIWIDVYELTSFLYSYRATTEKCDKESVSLIYNVFAETPD